VYSSNFRSRIDPVLKDILIFAAGAVMTSLGVRLSASSAFWDWAIGIGVTVMLLSVGHLLFENVVRPRLKGRKVDPLLVTAMTAALVAFGALAIYAIKGPQAGPVSTASNDSKVMHPEIALIPPSSRHEIIWNPKNILMLFSGPEGKVSTSISSTPIFAVKTVNNTYVQDATVKWQIEIAGIAKLVAESKNLSEYQIDISNNGIAISGKPNNLGSFTYRDQDLASSYEVPISFITNAGTNAYIPSNVYNNAALYVLALMPDTAGARIDPFTFSVTVSWNLPSPGSQKFLVKATIVNAKPPNVADPKLDAFMSFEVAKVQ
jgi:hypothetical protein